MDIKHPLEHNIQVSVDIKQHSDIASELRNCVKVQVDVLGSPSLIVRTVSVDGKHH